MQDSKYLRATLMALALLGLAVPWYFNTVYFLAGGSVMPGIFWHDAFANALTTGITLDAVRPGFNARRRTSPSTAAARTAAVSSGASSPARASRSARSCRNSTH